MSFFAGLLCAARSAMGVGGGGLLVIYLTAFAGFEQRAAQGVNLVFFLCASAFASVIHLKKRKINIKTALLFALGGLLGAILGCITATGAADALLRRAFGIFLIVSGALTGLKLLKKSPPADEKEK